MLKKQLRHHADRLTVAIEKLKELDDAVFFKAGETGNRLDFNRAWKIVPRAVKGNPMPPICLYGASITLGKAGAIVKLEKELEKTLFQAERAK